MQIPVVVIRDIESKLFGVRAAKGTLLTYNELTRSVSIPVGHGGSTVELSVMLQRDVSPLQWITLKRKGNS